MEAVAQRLGLSQQAMLEHLRNNLLGFEQRVGTSAHYLDVGASGQRSAALWSRLIDALEDHDDERLKTIVESEPEGHRQLEDLLLHYRFVFDADTVAIWTALASDFITLTDRDFARADLFRGLNHVDLTNPDSDGAFVALAEIGLSTGLIEPDEIEVLIATHAAKHLENRPADRRIDGRAVRTATVNAIRAAQSLDALPSLDDSRATIILIESVNDEASRVSMRQKERLLKDLGVEPKLLVLPHDTDPETLRRHVGQANRDPANLCTIVQLPIAEPLRCVLTEIVPEKDLDGLSGRQAHQRSATAEAVTRAMREVLSPGDRVLVIGGRGFVGGHIVAALEDAGFAAIDYDRSDALNVRRDHVRARQLRGLRAIVSATNQSESFNSDWCARYGINPADLKAIIDVGFITTPRTVPGSSSRLRRPIRGQRSAPYSGSRGHRPPRNGRAGRALGEREGWPASADLAHRRSRPAPDTKELAEQQRRMSLLVVRTPAPAKPSLISLAALAARRVASRSVGLRSLRSLRGG